MDVDKLFDLSPLLDDRENKAAALQYWRPPIPVGITIGILAFFNHFGKRRFSVDPTPMEGCRCVCMKMHIQTTLIEDAEKEEELDVDREQIVLGLIGLSSGVGGRRIICNLS